MQAALEIQALRQLKRKAWLTDAVRKAAAGDAQALLALRKRQGTPLARQAYAQRAGGQARAVNGLQAFYRTKYSSSHDTPSQSAQAILHVHAQPTTVIKLIEVLEVREVVTTCPSKKSTGSVGVTYEALNTILHSDPVDELVDA